MCILGRERVYVHVQHTMVILLINIIPSIVCILQLNVQEYRVCANKMNKINILELHIINVYLYLSVATDDLYQKIMQKLNMAYTYINIHLCIQSIVRISEEMQECL